MIKEMMVAALTAAALALPADMTVELDVADWLSLHPGETACGVTLQPGKQTALVNNCPVTLRGTPYVEKDVFYYPLEDIVELFGGTVQLDGDRVTVDTGEDGVFTFQIGSTAVTAEDGTVYATEGRQEYYTLGISPYRKEPRRPPVLRDGVVYVPQGFQLNEQYRPHYLWASDYAWTNTVIFDYGESGQEWNGYEIMTPFRDVPAQQRAKLQRVGPKGEVRDYYDEVEYRGDGYSVFVLEMKPGTENLDQMDGLISAIIVDDARYATPRGLRVGTTEERAWALYGWDLVMELGCEVENGIVTRWGYRSPYYSACGLSTCFDLVYNG